MRRAPPDPVVYASSLGGVPVALEIAKVLSAPLDLLLVRKIGGPGRPELAAGAVVDGERPDYILNADIMRSAGLTEADVKDRGREQLQEIELRRSLYMRGRPPVPARERSAILVDDGIATGASMNAAIAAIRQRDPRRIIVAVPIMTRSSVFALCRTIDEIFCLAAPDDFTGVGRFYVDFDQLSDKEVIESLALHARPVTEVEAASKSI